MPLLDLIINVSGGGNIINNYNNQGYTNLSTLDLLFDISGANSVSGFTKGDINISNGSLNGGLVELTGASSPGTRYSVGFSPSGGGSYVIGVSGNSFSELDGSGNNEATYTFNIDTIHPIVVMTGYNAANDQEPALNGTPNNFEKINVLVNVEEANLCGGSFDKSEFKCFYKPFVQSADDTWPYGTNGLEIDEAGFTLETSFSFVPNPNGELTLQIDPTQSFPGDKSYVNTLYKTDGVYTIIAEGGGITDMAENENIVAAPFVWKRSREGPEILYCAQNITGRYINDSDITSDVSIDIKIDFTFKELSVGGTSNFAAIDLSAGGIVVQDCTISNFELLPKPPHPITNKSYLATFTSTKEGNCIVSIPNGKVQDAMGNSNNYKKFEWKFSTGGVSEILPADLKIEVDQNPGVPQEIQNIQISIANAENITISGISMSDTLRIREDAWKVHHGHKSIRTNSNSVVKRAFAIKKLANLEKKI